MKVLLIAGARPNFMKIAPIYRASLNYPSIECLIVHTGQHYDYEMSDSFFDELEIPKPAYNLESGSGSHAVQTAKIMVQFEDVCSKESPDLVIVVGDVNSTLACSIVAKKLCIKVAHVEAGLRSFDMSMPEEINRMVTDAISDYFFVTEESGMANLLQEGKNRNRIYQVGHVMIDNLLYQASRLEVDDCSKLASYPLKIAQERYLFLTLHRPSNVDTAENLTRIMNALNLLARDWTIYFPVHPRTRAMLTKFDLQLADGIKLLPPLGFKDSLFLWKDAAAVLTDSGGLQEETTALGIPCVTIRDNTERPVTAEIGTNVLAGTSTEGILAAFQTAMKKCEKAKIPPLWDGKAAERIWQVLFAEFDGINRMDK